MNFIEIIAIIVLAAIVLIGFVVKALSDTELDSEDIICPVCGYYCLGNEASGCIDKPFLNNQ